MYITVLIAMESKLQKFQLKVNTGDKATEVFVLDSQFHRIAKGVGEELYFTLQAGLFIVKLQTGKKNIEKLIVLFKDMDIYFEPLEFISPVPLANLYQTSRSKTQIASDYSKKKESDVSLGKGSKLFVFGSIPKNLHTSNFPEQNTDPALGLTLKDFNDNILVDFGSPDIGTYSWEGEPWAACDMELYSGIYVLCVETNNGAQYKQTIVTCPGWQTQIFLQPRNYGMRDKDVRADLINSSILMSRMEYGFNPKDLINFHDGTSYRLIEQIRMALKCGRNTISKEILQTLTSGNLDNPMLGIYAAHVFLLNLQSSAFNFSEVKIIVENLRKLLGCSHPDVEAIALKIGMPTDYVFREFPMIANGWNFVLEASIKNPNLIPKDAITYTQYSQFWSNEFWLIWGKNTTNEKQELKQNILNIFQQEISPNTSKEIFRTFSKLTKVVASKQKVKEKILIHLPSYKKAIDNIMSNLSAHKLLQITQSLGVPHQKAIDLIQGLDLEDVTSAVQKYNIQLSSVDDDPQKNRWGNKSKNNFRKINATVLNSKIVGLYNVIINVASTKKELPLEGKVKFHLHNSFLNSTPIVPVIDGKATLKLTGVWGSFTVGAEVDEGKTQLELDLSKLRSVPQKFKVT